MKVPESPRTGSQCPVLSRSGTFPGLPGTSRDCPGLESPDANTTYMKAGVALVPLELNE